MKKRNWQKFFEKEAPKYLDNCFTKNTEFEVEFIIRELGLEKSDSILDIGCGTGRHSLLLAERGMNMTGIDLSHDMLSFAGKRAAEKGLEIEFIQGDASNICLDKKFDHSICICEGAFSLYEKGIEPFQYHRRILDNIYSMLKPGGRFLLTALSAFKKIREHTDQDVDSKVFDPWTITSVEHIRLDETTQVEVMEKGFFPSELNDMLEKSGFHVLYLGGGTAGDWGKRPVRLDEYELMAISEKR